MRDGYGNLGAMVLGLLHPIDLRKVRVLYILLEVPITECS
jgi:hypothetical protein